jgi:phosphatidate cytidylyltransferase
MNMMIGAEEALTRVVPVVAGALGIGGVAVAAVPARVPVRRDLRRRWAAWVVAAPVYLGAQCLGPAGGSLLAAAMGVIAGGEYARMFRLGRGERVVLGTAALVLPALALASFVTPHAFDVRLLALLLFAGALPALLSGDTTRGSERAARAVFGLLWIPVALTGLVMLNGTAVAVGLAVAFGDAGAWCGGRFLTRMGGGLARPLPPLSPARTWAGVLVAGIGVAVGLEVAGGFTVTLWAAVLSGCVLGDLLGAVIKREAVVEDAGTWLPGFGSGLLGRIGSLLMSLLLAMVVAL